jgi:hypothetical protein
VARQSCMVRWSVPWSARVAAGMAEHVGPNSAKLRLLAGHAHDVVDGLASELCAALGHEQPGQIVLPGSKVALDGAEFVASDRVLDAQAALEPSDPQPRALDIELIAPHLAGLADPQAVPENHEKKGVVANAWRPSLPPQAGDRSPDRSENPSSAHESQSFPSHFLPFACWSPSLRASKVLVLSSVSIATLYILHELLRVVREFNQKSPTWKGGAKWVRCPRNIIEPTTIRGARGHELASYTYLTKVREWTESKLSESGASIVSLLSESVRSRKATCVVDDR